MKKRKKAPQDVALMTGNPNDIVVVSPEEKPVKYQTEAAQAIKQLKSKLKAPEFVYLAPTEKVEVDKKADKQARDIKKIVSKLSTQEVTEEDFNNLFVSMNEGQLAKNAWSVATSPVRAVGLLGKAALGAGAAATLLSTPTTAAITSVGAAKAVSDKLAGFGKNKTSADVEKTSKYHTAIMKQNVAQSKERTKQAKIDTAVQKKRLDAINDIKKDVNKKIYAYNQANKGKDSIQTYSKSGVYGTPKAAPTSPTSNTAPSVIIPSTYRTRPSTSNTTIVSHREWDREKYIEEKNQLALQKKADKYGVDIEVVENVFKQGLVEYDERGNATINQFAMQRVNSFLANYLEERKTVMIRGKRRRIVGEPPGAVYTRTALKSSGKTKVLKTPMTVQQKQKRAIITLKRKLKQKVYEDAGSYMDSRPASVTAKQADELGAAAKKAFKPEYYEKDNEPAPQRRSWDYSDPDVKPIVQKYLNDKILDKKPLTNPTPTTEESDQFVNEGFIVDRAAGYSTTYTAADLGIKIQGGFALHPSVTEEGGAGDIGTDKLVNKYKKDTPGEAVGQLQRVIRARRKANTQC